MRVHLGTVLSVTTFALLAPDGIDDVQRFLSDMTGEDLFTHSLPRAAHECKPVILAPEFASAAAADEWLTEQVRIHGEYVDVEPIDPGQHEYIDPLAELVSMMAPSAKIVPVVLP